MPIRFNDADGDQYQKICQMDCVDTSTPSGIYDTFTKRWDRRNTVGEPVDIMYDMFNAATGEMDPNRTVKGLTTHFSKCTECPHWQAFAVV